MVGDASSCYRRPRLCRLCECPVVDGGVRLRKKSLDKLSRWWEAHLDTDSDQKACTVCYFCVWDLRYADENSEENEPEDQNWWIFHPEMKNNNAKKYYYYYEEEQMKPCFVQMKQLDAKTFSETAENKPELQEEEVPQTENTRPTAKCLYCSNILSSEALVRVHIRRNHGDISIKCPQRLCGRFFTSTSDLEHHFLATSHDKKSASKHNKKSAASGVEVSTPFSCDHCPKSFSVKGALNQHYRRAHAPRERCVHCQNAIVHMSGHVISVRCLKCEAKFACLGLKRQHRCPKMSCKSIRSYRPFDCPVCEKYFKFEYKRLDHCRRRHTVTVRQWRGVRFASRGFGCEECLIYVSSKGQLDKHKINVHSRQVSTCDFCGKKYGNKVKLTAHILRFHFGKYRPRVLSTERN